MITLNGFLFSTLADYTLSKLHSWVAANTLLTSNAQSDHPAVAFKHETKDGQGVSIVENVVELDDKNYDSFVLHNATT